MSIHYKRQKAFAQLPDHELSEQRKKETRAKQRKTREIICCDHVSKCFQF